MFPLINPHTSLWLSKRDRLPHSSSLEILFSLMAFLRVQTGHLFIQGMQRKGATSLLLSFSSLAKRPLGTKVELLEAVCLRPRTGFTDNRINSLMGLYLFQIAGNDSYNFLRLNPDKHGPFPPAPSYMRSSTSRCPYQILINKSLSYTIGLREHMKLSCCQLSSQTLSQCLSSVLEELGRWWPEKEGWEEIRGY